MPSFATGMRCFPLVLAVVPALCAQDADLPERLFRSGERAYAIRAYPEALETWNQLIQQAPKSPFTAHALMNLARGGCQGVLLSGGSGSSLWGMLSPPEASL